MQCQPPASSLVAWGGHPSTPSAESCSCPSQGVASPSLERDCSHVLIMPCSKQVGFPMEKTDGVGTQ